MGGKLVRLSRRQPEDRREAYFHVPLHLCRDRFPKREPKEEMPCKDFGKRNEYGIPITGKA